MPQDSTDRTDRTLREHVRVLRRHAVLIATAVGLAGASALVFSVLKTPSYVATASVSFSDQSKDLAAAGIPAGQNPTPDKFAAAEASVARSPAVVARVKRTLRLRQPAADLRGAVTTNVDPSSNLVDISASTSSAGLSARLANGFARQTQVVLTRRQRDQYARAARGLRAKLGDLPENSTLRRPYLEGLGRLVTLSAVAQPVQIQQPAEVPSGPASPKPLLYTILGAFLGLLGGCAAAFLRDALDRRLRDPNEVEQQLGFTLLGYVPSTVLGQIGAAQNGGGPPVEDFEPFRILKRNCEFLDPGQAQKTVAVTSPLAEEGKSTVAAGLAAANALAGIETLLVEADLRKPVLADRLGIRVAPGLTDYLAGAAESEEIAQVVDVAAPHGPEFESTPAKDDQRLITTGVDTRFVCVTAGRMSSSPAELLGSKRFAAFVKSVRETYELVIFDTAPLLPVGDTLELLTSVDGILLCIRLAQTTRDQALAARSSLERLPDRSTGVVITGIKPTQGEGYYGYEYVATSEAGSP
jgi:succinoglycan biosynthesis transport protein ExoP